MRSHTYTASVAADEPTRPEGVMRSPAAAVQNRVCAVKERKQTTCRGCIFYVLSLSDSLFFWVLHTSVGKCRLAAERTQRGHDRRCAPSSGALGGTTCVLGRMRDNSAEPRAQLGGTTCAFGGTSVELSRTQRNHVRTRGTTCAPHGNCVRTRGTSWKLSPHSRNHVRTLRNPAEARAPSTEARAHLGGSAWRALGWKRACALKAHEFRRVAHVRRQCAHVRRRGAHVRRRGAHARRRGAHTCCRR